MSVAFGLDFAGYSSGKTGLACAEQVEPDRIDITVLTGHIFTHKRKGRTVLASVVEQERNLLRQCAWQGPVMIDLPLDLEALPRPVDTTFAWALTQRPVDYALNAMPPLANLIGAPVARLLHLLRDLPDTWIGSRLFETYPACSLDLLGLRGRGYKSGTGVQMAWQAGAWHGTDRAAVMADNANRLGWLADDGLTLNDDEFDAALCALTGIAAIDCQLRGERLDAEITRRICARIPPAYHQNYHAPPSFMLLEKLPAARVYLQKRPVSQFFSPH